MKALITGGAGFIGSHLAEALVEAGHDTFVVDDFSTGTSANVEPIVNHPMFHCCHGSVMDEELMRELVDGCDVIFHLAAAVGVKMAIDSPLYTHQTNVDGTAKVLSLAHEKRRKVILMSSSEVYGDTKEIPFREDGHILLHSASKSRWSYAWSKAMAECLAMAYWHEHRLPVVVVRPFNVVGPRQSGRYGMGMPRLVHQAITGAPLTIYGDGQQSRCFSHIAYVVRGMIGLAQHPETAGNIFNIGNDQEVTIESLVFLIKELAESESPTEYIPYNQVYEERFADIQRRIPDLTKIRDFIGYRATHDLTAIIRSVIDYQRSQDPVSSG